MAHHFPPAEERVVEMGVERLDVALGEEAHKAGISARSAVSLHDSHSDDGAVEEILEHAKHEFISEI